MGELNLCADCGGFSPFIDGARAAMITVLVAWLPAVIAGLVLADTGMVHATMRGAGPLRALGRLAITVLIAATGMPLLMTAMFVVDAASRSELSLLGACLVVTISLGIMMPVAAVSIVGIRAWHRVLLELTSHPGEGRMLV
jgi:hypothetical protein